MEKNELISQIRSQLPKLPLTFRYLGALKEQEECSNYFGLDYKPETIYALQTNDEPVGFFYKQISRFIHPVAVNSTEQPDSLPEETATITMPVAIEPDKQFKLFACCFPVKGASRSIICDIQRQHFSFIPNILYDLLVQDSDTTFAEMVAIYGAENEPILREYFDFLLDQEYGFWTTAEEARHFPEVSMEWDSPLAITNSIIDMDANSDFDIPSLITQLDELGCSALQLRSFSQRSLDFFDNLLQHIAGSRIKTIDIVLPWYDGLDIQTAVDFSAKYQRINNFVIHGAPFTKFEGNLNKNLTRIIFTQEAVTGEHHCGLVFADYFVVNMTMFTESHHFNSCLNRKISVDKAGYIRNCPSMPEDFGHVRNTTLKAALAHNGFTEKWGITKDQCSVCRDCEFRYGCTDCRAYTQLSGQDGYGKPAHCHYNPYTATWEYPGWVVADDEETLHSTLENA